MDLALNNLQRLICHETQTTNQLHPPMWQCLDLIGKKSSSADIKSSYAFSALKLFSPTPYIEIYDKSLKLKAF